MRSEIQTVLRDTPVVCMEISVEERLKMCDALWSDKDSGEEPSSYEWLSEPDEVRDKILEKVRPTEDAGSIRLELENRELALLRDVLRKSGYRRVREEIIKIARPIEDMSGQTQIDASVRKDVLENKGGACVGCGMTKREHIDKHDCRLLLYHVVDYCRFNRQEDANRLDNLIPLCRDCNEAIEGTEKEDSKKGENNHESENKGTADRLLARRFNGS
ncbi:HNH endonuclease [Haladaptatus sp. F3-133]|uniref:HNH endonuclease n=1 Tax=Halorutilus salinus TaxID=2487751 RepID=A0A9Q4C4B3_9EURY|nr:HNH endonuclease [Halorutilus salinus]MCX2818214.1 HNH endonuclease [Halorutilus salinus]